MRYAWRAAAAVALLAVAWHEIEMTHRFWGFTEKSGALAAVERLARAIPPDALILFTHPGNDVLVTTPLAMHLGRSRSTLYLLIPLGRHRRTSAVGCSRRRWPAGCATVARSSISRRRTAMRRIHAQRPMAVGGHGWNHGSDIWSQQKASAAGTESSTTCSTPYCARAIQNPDVLPPCAPRALRADAVLLGIGRRVLPGSKRGNLCDIDGSDRGLVWCFRPASARQNKPRVLRIRAACGPRPSKTPCRVGVDVNGASAGQLTLTDAWSIVDLRIPDSAAAAPTGAFDVRFSGPRSVQAEAGMGNNRREVSFELAERRAAARRHARSDRVQRRPFSQRASRRGT